jgi:SOS-response transcriptional repressor LexA
MSELSNNLRALMHDVGITVTELARQTGVGQPVIHRMASGETDNPKVGSLSPIAKFFNVNISMLIGDEPLPAERFKSSHNPYYRSWSKLPLLSWEQATVWPHQQIPKEIESYISTESKVSDKAFAVRMEDNTMLPRYPKGTIFIIEPDLTPQDKDFAAVRVGSQATIQFKQIMFDGEDLYLKPLNSDFEIKRIDKPYDIVGVMVQSLTEYYQDRVYQVDDSDNTHQTAQPVKKKKILSESEELSS